MSYGDLPYAEQPYAGSSTASSGPPTSTTSITGSAETDGVLVAALAPGSTFVTGEASTDAVVVASVTYTTSISGSAESSGTVTATVQVSTSITGDAGTDGVVTAVVVTATSISGDASTDAVVIASVAASSTFITGEAGADGTVTASVVEAVVITGSAETNGTVVASVAVGTTISGSAQTDAVVVAVSSIGGVIRNRVGGRSRQALGTATWSPPVVAPPITVVEARRRDHAQAFGPVTMGGPGGTKPRFDVQAVSRKAHRDRILVGGVDVTYFRGVTTPMPGYSLVEPLMYGPTSITFPQIAGAFERHGTGALRWLRFGAPVVIQRVNPDTNEVVATDYRGLVIAIDSDGGRMTAQVGGELMGRAAMQHHPVPIFPQTSDLGLMAYQAVRETGLRLDPYRGPTTGITAREWGGQSLLEQLHQIIAMTWTAGGERWTVMPTSERGEYTMRRKDRETIHGTVYPDDAIAVATLTRDFSEEPNRIFMAGITPEGQRVRFGAYPGLQQTRNPPAYPGAGPSFGAGTTDADTTSGEGVTVLVIRLRVTGYLSPEDAPGGYDADVTRAVRALQREAGLPVTGNVNAATWRALWDLSATGLSLGWSKVLPAAERSVVRRWRRSATGAIIGRNPGYDPTHPKVDRAVDAGVGFTRPQLREWSQHELDDAAAENWCGFIVFNEGGLIVGEHTPGDPITEDDLMRARGLRPGMNLRLPLFAGTGITVHVSAVTVDAEGTVRADVDTRARDAMEVWEVQARNRESRRSPYREWLRDHRGSTQTKDSMVVWDEVGGVLGSRVTLPGGQWTVFPVLAGEAGTIGRLRTRTIPAAEYVVAVFGSRIAPGRLAGLVGDPLSKAGAKRWADETVRDALDASNTLLYVAGTDEDPCGYWPHAKSEGTADDDANDTGDDEVPTPPLTGRWQDDAGFAYRCPTTPLLWVAVWSDRDSTIPGGRIMWNQLEAGV